MRVHTARVNNGCAGPSPGASAVPQLADDLCAPSNSTEVGQEETNGIAAKIGCTGGMASRPVH
jgi:hypothetical protein